MTKKCLFLSIFTVIFNCGRMEVNRRNYNSDISDLKQVVLQLQGTISQLNAFVAHDFADCETGLPPFETKICKIAQTATAEQRLEFSSQLAEMSKVFQTELFGEDCVNSIDIGCPTNNSILYRLDVYNSNISSIQVDILNLQSDLATLESRLDNFNGTGESIETVILSNENAIILIKDRLNDIENTINNNTIFKSISLCRDIVDSGPLYETVLFESDRLSITAYIQTGSKSGLGHIKEFGDGSGDLFLMTNLNSKNCRFKIYEDYADNKLRICWNNSNRNSSEANIDLECDYLNNFSNMSNNCTCE